MHREAVALGQRRLRFRSAAAYLTGCLALTAAVAGPRLEIAATEIDLGSLSKGETAEARFELRNSGDEVLRILEAKPG